MQNTAMTGIGRLRIAVNTANGALPVSGASVQVYSADQASGAGLLYSLRTGAGGLTETVELAAPPRAESLVPGVPAPYARYNIAVEKDGYGGVRNIGVPIFDGIVSTQPVTLVPLSEFESSREEEIVESAAGENPLL